MYNNTGILKQQFDYLMITPPHDNASKCMSICLVSWTKLIKSTRAKFSVKMSKIPFTCYYMDGQTIGITVISRQLTVANSHKGILLSTYVQVSLAS